MKNRKLAIAGAALTLYFLPSLIAFARRHRNGSAVFMLNLCSGWTIIGWIIALTWAVVREPSSY
jgi:hypothetical protein